eukprot:2816357-Prymnesium_polylepis.1
MPSKLTCAAHERRANELSTYCARAGKVHEASSHFVDQLVEQLITIQCGHPLHLDQLVERVSDREHRIVAKRVVYAFNSQCRCVGPNVAREGVLIRGTRIVGEADGRITMRIGHPQLTPTGKVLLVRGRLRLRHRQD